MKVISFVKFKAPLTLASLLAVLFFTPSAFAQVDSSNDSSKLLVEIKKKLDASQKREELILAGQDKILEEIIKSRKWARHG